MLEAPGKSKRKENPPRTLSGFTAVLPSLIPRAEPFCTGFELQHSPSALVAASADDDDDFGCGGGDVGCSFRKPPSPHGTHTRTVYGAASTLTTRRQQTVTILHHLWLARSAVLPQNRTTLGDSDGNVSMRRPRRRRLRVLWLNASASAAHSATFSISRRSLTCFSTSYKFGYSRLSRNSSLPFA